MACSQEKTGKKKGATKKGDKKEEMGLGKLSCRAGSSVYPVGFELAPQGIQADLQHCGGLDLVMTRSLVGF